MKIKFTSCFLDHSGYSQAARNLLLAMVEAGLEVQTEIVNFSPGQTELDAGGKLAVKLSKKKLDYNQKIIMLTPEMFPKYTEKGIKNIGLLFWEVLGVDERWVACMNQMDEIWTPSKIYAETFVKSGVKVPVKTLGQPLMEWKGLKPFKINFDGFKFYSIFQWTERKNPRGLLNAYWRTFQGRDDVALFLKVYRGNFLETEVEAIRNDIKTWKKQTLVTSFPKTFLIPYEMTPREIARLHLSCDCFVSAHRGEGWGYPQMEAMAAGKPVISTNFGGIHEYLKDEFSWKVKFNYVPVFGMNHIPWYNKSQLWAEADREDLSFSMWEAYINPDLTKYKGKKAKEFVKKTFAPMEIGKQIIKLLEK